MAAARKQQKACAIGIALCTCACVWDQPVWKLFLCQPSGIVWKCETSIEYYYDAAFCKCVGTLGEGWRTAFSFLQTIPGKKIRYSLVSSYCHWEISCAPASTSLLLGWGGCSASLPFFYANSYWFWPETTHLSNFSAKFRIGIIIPCILFFLVLLLALVCGDLKKLKKGHLHLLSSKLWLLLIWCFLLPLTPKPFRHEHWFLTLHVVLFSAGFGANLPPSCSVWETQTY